MMQRQRREEDHPDVDGLLEQMLYKPHRMEPHHGQKPNLKDPQLRSRI
jgi:hypothetical protein